MISARDEAGGIVSMPRVFFPHSLWKAECGSLGAAFYTGGLDESTLSHDGVCLNTALFGDNSRAPDSNLGNLVTGRLLPILG